MTNLHGTCVSLQSRDLQAGVLLLGPAQCGKSSLACRLMDEPSYGLGGNDFVHAQLVADDQILVEAKDGQVWASCPPSISGLIEASGLGVIEIAKDLCTAGPVAIDLAVRYTPQSETERLPEPDTVELEGIKLPQYSLDFMAPDSAMKVKLMAQLHWQSIRLAE